MSQINQIQDKQTHGFAEACYDQNSIAELQACLNATEPDVTDMKNWGITADQWKEAITAALEDKSADAVYNYTLNEAGQKELLAAIQAISTEKLTNPTAYFSDAEENADRWNSDEDPSIEIAGKYTQSGNPEIIQLKKSWFDSEIVD